MANVSNRNFSKVEKANLKNSYWNASVVEFVLNKILGRGSRPSTILKRSLHHGGFLLLQGV